MSQKNRRILVYISLFLFPVTLYYFSPYVSMEGAFQGVVTGSVLVFAAQLVTAVFFRRAWCGWLCPMAGLSECTMSINGKDVSVRKLRIVRYTIFAIWFAALVSGFAIAGGVKSIQPLFNMESIVSVDEAWKYGIYYGVLFTFFLLSVLLGKRGGCHAICWMSPFLTLGAKIGDVLHLPQLKIVSESDKCIDCKICNKKCPMSIDVASEQKKGAICSGDCIQCGECADACPKKVLKLRVSK